MRGRSHSRQRQRCPTRIACFVEKTRLTISSVCRTQGAASITLAALSYCCRYTIVPLFTHTLYSNFLSSFRLGVITGACEKHPFHESQKVGILRQNLVSVLTPQILIMLKLSPDIYHFGAEYCNLQKNIGPISDSMNGTHFMSII